MGTLLVGSPFYSRPEDEEDAIARSPLAPSSSESRIVDFKYRENNGRYTVKYVADKIKDASRLKSLLGPPPSPVSNGPPLKPQLNVDLDLHTLDRLFYENNWPYARNLLCRKYIKGVVDDYSILTGVQEDSALMKYQMFLNSSDKPDQLRELDFSYFGLGSTSDGGLLTGDKRLLYFFGFDWVAVPSGKLDQDPAFKQLNTRKGTKWAVRRRTCVGSVLKMKTTKAFDGLCRSSWDSKLELSHRRTVILFNELHSKVDGLGFQAWLSNPELWTITERWNTSEDNEVTAVTFIYRLVCQIWEKVIMEWKNVVDQCSEHIRTSEKRALDKNINVQGLEDLAHSTWQDSLDWSTLSQLIDAQRKTVISMSGILEGISTAVKATTTSEALRLQKVLTELGDVNIFMSQDFPRRGQSISDLVYNIINVRNAQASENYNKEIGAITWITFIFFPLIAIAGMFGMNVDILANNPSIKWYFIIAIPFTVLVLIIAFLIRGRKWIKASLLQRRRHKGSKSIISDDSNG